MHRARFTVSPTKSYDEASIIRKATAIANKRSSQFYKNLKRLLEGETAINMNVKEFPSAPEAVAVQSALLERMTKSYAEDGSLKISVMNEEAFSAVPKA